MEVDLTNSELFKSFAEFEQGGVYINLHNEFDCNDIEFSNDTKQLRLSFKPNEYCKREVNSVEVVFDDCIIEFYSSKLDKTDAESSTLDIMYRGRFEKDGELAEVLDSRMYYYVDLLPDIAFELFARSVKANVNII